MQRLLRSLQAFLLAVMLMFTAVGSLTIVPDVALADTNIGATQSVLVAEVDKAAIRRGLDAPVNVGDNEKMWLNLQPDSGAADSASCGGQFCGGIGSIQCCEGFRCVLTDPPNQSDRGGVCVKK